MSCFHFKIRFMFKIMSSFFDSRYLPSQQIKLYLE